jgi:methionine-rich copper-binding protein CopC
MQFRWYHWLAIAGGLLGIAAILILGTLFINGTFNVQRMTDVRVGFVGTSIPGHMVASYQYLDDTIDSQVTAETGEMLVMTHELQVEQGTLSLEVQNPQGATIKRIERKAPGEANGQTNIDIPQDGTYRLLVQGKETRGAYDIRWNVVSQASPTRKTQK